MTWPVTDELIERIRTATPTEIDEIGRRVTAVLLESFGSPGFDKVLAETVEIGTALRARVAELAPEAPADPESE